MLIAYRRHFRIFLRLARARVQTHLSRSRQLNQAILALVGFVILVSVLRRLIPIDRWKWTNEPTIQKPEHPAQCDELFGANEWFSLDKRYFFKKTGAFYIVDVNRIRLLMVLRMSIPRAGKYDLLPLNLNTFSIGIAIKSAVRSFTKTRFFLLVFSAFGSYT